MFGRSVAGSSPGPGERPIRRFGRFAARSIASTRDFPDRLDRARRTRDRRRQHLAFVRGQRSASFLQTPAWGRVKSEWRHESLGWFARRRAGRRRAGALPPAARRSSATSPTCPRARSSTGTTRTSPAGWRPMAAHLKEPRRVRRPDGPAGRHPPLGRRHRQGRHRRRRRTTGSATWPRPSAATPAPGWSPSCVELGWRPQAVEGGFAAGQPQYVFQVPLAGRTEERRARRDEPALAPQHQEGRQGGRRGHVVRRRGDASPS